jgi:protein tyrosine phosphatase (PTP) superfamily phosphohydrolase (DUF442 family)
MHRPSLHNRIAARLVPRRRDPAMRPLLRTAGVITVCLGMLLPSACIHTPAVTPRPGSWAQPVEAEKLPNLHRVTKDLYRCAQPRDKAYSGAHQMGIRTVVNLRPGAGPAESARYRDPEVINIPVCTSDPSYEEAHRFFEIIDDPAKRPVLLHCYHGADRTGALTALYRINRQRWSTENAISEMTGGGYNFHAMWIDLADWVREAPEF